MTYNWIITWNRVEPVPTWKQTECFKVLFVCIKGKYVVASSDSDSFSGYFNMLQLSTELGVCSENLANKKTISG